MVSTSRNVCVVIDYYRVSKGCIRCEGFERSRRIQRRQPMKRSTQRILTTHVGSLARPKDLLDLMKAKVNGEPYNHDAYAERVRSAVAEIVRRQVESGIDVVTD